MTPPTFPSTSADDTLGELRGARPIDRLMVRVLGPLLAVGAAAIALLWWSEHGSGKISAVNRYAYPFMLVLFSTSWVLLRRRPRLARPVRWAAFVCVAASLLSDLGHTLFWQTWPLLGNYSAVTMLVWLPIMYALAFILLDARPAVWAACGMLALIGAGAAGRLARPGSPPDDVDLLLSVLASHAVLIACLAAWLRMKELLARQHGQALQLRTLAATDPLTGLANRRQALSALHRAAAQAAPDQPPPVALLCDVDHFKRVNDQLGHEAGDAVLGEVALALRRATRGSDTVARWGGEEFLVLLPASPVPEALELAGRLRQRVAEASAAGSATRLGGVTMSIGLAARRPGEPPADWLRRTDEALYAAKRLGRNRCEVAG